MGVFEKIFSSHQKKAILDEINLMEAAQAHIVWKLRLLRYLDGSSTEQLDPAVVCRDDQCKLGVWIHGIGQSHFGSEAAFQVMRADHAIFHQHAGQIVRYSQVKKLDEARALLNGKYRQVSYKVVMALTELNSELKT
jgi:hypothetical protein